MKKNCMDVCGLLETKLLSSKVVTMYKFRLSNGVSLQMLGLPAMQELLFFGIH